MNPLAILAVGLYGQVLPNQNGAPLRLVVPWKYGFKGIKSIVKIQLTAEEPLDHLERHGAPGVRLLRERESERSITPAGARRPSGGSASSGAARP